MSVFKRGYINCGSAGRLSGAMQIFCPCLQKYQTVTAVVAVQ